MSVALLDVNVLIAILETFNLPQVSDSPEYILNLEDLPKFDFLYSPESQIPLNIDLLGSIIRRWPCPWRWGYFRHAF